MTAAEFSVLIHARCEKTHAVLNTKGEEYSVASDKLYNFKATAKEFGGTPEQALWGFMKKHLMSIKDMVDGVREPTPEMVNEKIGDAVNYLILLEALFLERMQCRQT
jgi:hypothetical protein